MSETHTWVYGDGQSEVFDNSRNLDNNPVDHTYATGGTYLAIFVWAWGGAGTDSWGIQEVTVTGPTGFSVTAVPDYGYVPLRTVITATDGGTS
jgi:hypothetical protein